MLLALLLLSPSDEAHARNWQKKEGAVIVPHDANDGDSFHARHNRRRYIFRIYWVDAPETDRSLPDRVAEQAEYWGISENDVVRLGKQATKVAMDFLKDGFTAHTRLQDALGRSARNRHYALVEVDGKFLCELLVEQGLARIHGVRAMPPWGPSVTAYRMRLIAAENHARRNRLGAWAIATKEPPFEEVAVVLTSTVAILDPENPSRQMGLLPPGNEVTAYALFTPVLVRVRFTTSDGRTIEGLANRGALGL
ncbi:MAG TPA: thermonuclease family protein [Kiritimatiellia bacterium]|nr:thermonuclease family protein [Kiritimatiellia bacterium]